MIHLPKRDMNWLSTGRSAFGFCAVKDDKVIVSIRGTSKLWDLWTDAKFSLVPERAGGRVHKGFQQALDTIWPRLERALISYGVKETFFTGHSLGGAIATIAAARSRWRPVQIYTNGAPRVGDKDFVASLDGIPWFRNVGSRDIMPRLPFRWLGYADGGEETSYEGLRHSIADMVAMHETGVYLETKLASGGLKRTWSRRRERSEDGLL